MCIYLQQQQQQQKKDLNLHPRCISNKNVIKNNPGLVIVRSISNFVI
jgi:hypothetical protein